jgi:hypothetical protein
MRNCMSKTCTKEKDQIFTRDPARLLSMEMAGGPRALLGSQDVRSRSLTSTVEQPLLSAARQSHRRAARPRPDRGASVSESVGQLPSSAGLGGSACWPLALRGPGVLPDSSRRSSRAAIVTGRAASQCPPSQPEQATWSQAVS